MKIFIFYRFAYEKEKMYVYHIILIDFNESILFPQIIQ